MTDKTDDFNAEKSVKDLSDTINQPNKFAELFCNAARTQIVIEEVLKEKIVKLIRSDEETKKLIKEYSHEIDEEDWRSFLKKVGSLTWSIILIILGAILGAIAKTHI